MKYWEQYSSVEESSVVVVVKTYCHLIVTIAIEKLLWESIQEEGGGGSKTIKRNNIVKVFSFFF